MSQGQARWNYGLSAHNSIERYNMTYNTLYVDRPNTASKGSVKSAIAGGVGIWVERKIHSFLAVSSRLDYHSVRIDEEFFSGWYIKVGGGREYQEWHRSMSLSLVGRGYLPLKSKLRINIDAGLKADRIVNFRSRYSHFDFRNWNHPYFSNLATGWVARVGVRRSSMTLNAHFRLNRDAKSKLYAQRVTILHHFVI
ncbi:hypothetical protein SAMN05216327_106386 [Dyadobacter sp. SG02]|uniref:hypothetical protein n=1 Tax=Dyadobacter sp. SG02 TaxID=1855291 RepID=UPI0008CDC313|nr:hypothetical protein [Dyadobacter sp. SG02]SEJ15720.1 hypothetical protein SAMN05216327_106386 [Dyadobacter sp. SG02]